jgi:hypothetical protein
MALDVLPDPFPATEAPTRARYTSLGQLSPWRHSFNDGSKFAGGYGYTNLLTTDYWTLRARSSELFETNIYARGIVRRLITNEINDGLKLQSMPEEAILGKPEDSLSDWTEEVENRFQLWCDRPLLCDQAERQSFGALQAVARMEALVDGDVLVVLRQDPRTGLPRVQLVKGSQVQTPMNALSSGATIKHGVELDSSGRHTSPFTSRRKTARPSGCQRSVKRAVDAWPGLCTAPISASTRSAASHCCRLSCSRSRRSTGSATQSSALPWLQARSRSL